MATCDPIPQQIQHQPKIIDVEKISAFYELNENQNKAEEKIKPLRRLFTSDEDLSMHHEKLSQIAFISQDIVCIKDELGKLLQNLKQAESANTCVFTIAAIAYRGLFRIMPYQSHNEKTARALINDLLINYGYHSITSPAHHQKKPRPICKHRLVRPMRQ